MPTSSGRFGYTEKQAERAKHRIDVQVAKVEDALRAMRALVSDINPTTASVETPLEEIRAAADELKAIVDRRTL